MFYLQYLKHFLKKLVPLLVSLPLPPSSCDAGPWEAGLRGHSPQPLALYLSIVREALAGERGAGGKRGLHIWSPPPLHPPGWVTVTQWLQTSPTVPSLTRPWHSHDLPSPLQASMIAAPHCH